MTTTEVSRYSVELFFGWKLWPTVPYGGEDPENRISLAEPLIATGVNPGFDSKVMCAMCSHKSELRPHPANHRKFLCRLH